MYLSKLEIFGFKSFAHKFTFQFQDGITAIIGPNGCGKSNIVDAIRWVLGEQRPSLLRLDKMDNLIFNGTAVRKPLSMVEVSILIENTKKILPSIFSEVKITRRLYRSGESEYLLNNRQVRLKDVIDLFADTGMGSDAYSVIELKMVEQILSDNAEERRRLFEEAAGIKKYKFRRKSAMRKLEVTEQELVRLNDVLSEVQKNVNSLSRQVGKARRYHEYKTDLKRNELYIYQLRKTHYEEDLVPLREEFDQISQTRERSGKEVNQAEAELEKLQVKSVDLENQFREVSSRLSNFDNRVREIQEQVRLNEQKVESYRQNISERETESVQLEQRLTELAAQMKAVHEDIKTVSSLVSGKDRTYREALKIQQQSEQTVTDLRRKFQNFVETNVSQLQELSGQRQDYHKITIEKESIESQRQKILQQINHLKEERSSRLPKYHELEKEWKTAVKDSEITRREIEALRKRMPDLEQELEVLENERNTLLGKLEKNTSRRDFLHTLIENYEGFTESVQYIMGNRKSYGGLIDTLANLVDTGEEFRPALESYLEGIANYLVVEGVDSARHILSEVRRQKKGRLTLIPLTLLNGSRNGNPRHSPEGEDIRQLKDIVTYDPRYEKLFGLLFEGVWLVKDMDAALSYHTRYPDFKFLTREGELVGTWGNITGGHSEFTLNLIGRKEQYQAILEEGKRLEQRLSELDQKRTHQREQHQKTRSRLEEFLNVRNREIQTLSDFERQVNQEKYETDRLQQQQNELKDELKLQEERVATLQERETALYPSIQLADRQQNQLREEESHLARELELAEQEYRRLSQDTQQQQIEFIRQQNRNSELQQQLAFLQKSEEEARQRITQIGKDLSLYLQNIQNLEQEMQAARSGLESLYTQRDGIEKEKVEVENNYQALKSLILSREEETKKLHRRWNQALERLKELELRIQENEIKLRTQQEQIEGQFGEELKTFLAENPIPEYADQQKIQEDITRLRQSLEFLGEVNPLAVKDYDREKERLDFLRSQHADLLEAKAELLETIQKLNKTARTLFVETFDKINENFRGVFGKFFEGGNAELVLVDNEDPLESNIDIVAHVKGRRLNTLNLLSAGEKTLTAISLLFAIYLYKPSPFCILDEVDAPLDDVNIARYTHALKEFSNNTQFILVTHNKMTMQSAQAMYGITMEEPGVSKVVSVRFS